MDATVQLFTIILLQLFGKHDIDNKTEEIEMTGALALLPGKKCFFIMDFNCRSAYVVLSYGYDSCNTKLINQQLEE